jgi:hypothetical protein
LWALHVSIAVQLVWEIYFSSYIKVIIYL